MRISYRIKIGETGKYELAETIGIRERN